MSSAYQSVSPHIQYILYYIDKHASALMQYILDYAVLNYIDKHTLFISGEHGLGGVLFLGHLSSQLRHYTF